MQATTITYEELGNKLDGYILCNEILKVDEEIYHNTFNGQFEYCAVHDDKRDCKKNSDNCEYTEEDIYQSYLISESDAAYLKDHTDEIILYSPLLDLYVWGVTHWGTSWTHVYVTFKELS